MGKRQGRLTYARWQVDSFSHCCVVLHSPLAESETVRLVYAPPLERIIRATAEVRTTMFDNKSAGHGVVTESEQRINELTFTSESR